MSVQLGPTRRRGSGTLDFAAYNFAGGLNVRSAPQEVGDHDLTKAQDVYLRSDGGVNLRNGMAAYSAAIGSGQLILARFYQDVRSGIAFPEITKLLGQVGNTLYNITATSNTTIGTINATVPANPMTWARIQNPDDPNFPAGLTDVIVICTGSGGPYVYDGTNLYTPPGWVQATSASWCAVVNGILWFGGIPKVPNQIFGCGDGITASMETLPAYRNFALSAPVSGLCAIGTGANAILAIGRNTGLSLLYGTGPSTFYLQDVPFPDGVTAGRSMVSGSGVLYFLGHMAYYTFDGTTTPVRASDKIEPWILNDPIAGLNGFPMTGNFNLSWATIYNNRIHLGYCSNGASVPNTVLCLDLVTRGWTVLVPQPGLSSMILLDAPSDPNPYVAYVGSSTTGQAYQWDYTAIPQPAGTLIWDEGRWDINTWAATALTTNALPVLDGAIPVLAQAQSKYFKVGVPGTNKTLTRWYPEFLVSATPFSIPVTISTDYGNATTSNAVTQPGTSLVWDVGEWDVNTWAGSGFTSFNAPASRIDVDIQAEAFAFGFQMNAALAPFIWAGGSGSYQQRGRT
jgi:hypothetical protein